MIWHLIKITYNLHRQVPKLPSCTRKNAWKSQWKFCISAHSCIFEWMNQLASSGQSLDANFGGEVWFIIKIYNYITFPEIFIKSISTSRNFRTQNVSVLSGFVVLHLDGSSLPWMRRRRHHWSRWHPSWCPRKRRCHQAWRRPSGDCCHSAWKKCFHSGNHVDGSRNEGKWK